MTPEDYHSAKKKCFWRMLHFGHDEVEVWRKYRNSIFERRPHGEVLFQYTLEGRVKYEDRHGQFEVPAGHAFIGLYGEACEYWRPEEWRERYVCEWVQITGAGLPEYITLLKNKHGPVLPFTLDSILGETFLKMVKRPRLDEHAADLERTRTVHEFVLQLFRHCEERALHGQAPVDRAIDGLLRDPLAPWSLKALVKQYGCTREHFTRVFHERVGQPPAKYLSQIRVQKALELLKETSMPMVQIARQSGFSSTHTMARQIRAVTGKSPSSMRENFSSK